MAEFSGLGMDMGNLSRLSRAQNALDQPGEFHRRKGQGRHGDRGHRRDPCARPRPDGSGRGWKVSPSIRIEPGENRTLAEIEGSGAIQQIWMTTANLRWRDLILRIYWDDQEHPSVEAPLGDFFCSGWNQYAQVSSLAVCVNPGRAFNCYWEMPFRKRARIDAREPRPDELRHHLLPDQLHADRRARGRAPISTPSSAAPIRCPSARTTRSSTASRAAATMSAPTWPGASTTIGWWGEGEIKFFMDGDGEFPTICGTGTEDYFCGAYNFDGGVDRPDHGQRATASSTTPYAGLPQVHPPRRHLRASSASACIAGTSPTRSASRATSGSPSRRSAGAPKRGPPLPAAAGRHRLGRLLVPDAADRRLRAAGIATIST